MLVEQKKTREMSGIRGLLLLFVIVLGLNCVYGVLYGVDAILLGSSDGYIGGAVTLALAGYGVAVFVLLVRRYSDAPWHARLLLLVGAVLGFIGMVLTYAVARQFDYRGLLAAVVSMVWWSYFGTSKRVAATYGPGRPNEAKRTHA